jgi:hypothetical protein
VTAFEEFVAAVETATGRRGRRVGRQTRLLCPAHDDHNPSLDVSEGDDGRPLATCRSHGCSFEAICHAIGREPEDFTPATGPEWTPAGPAAAIYDYTDETGQLLFQVCRTADKQFLQRRPDPTSRSGWKWNLEGVRRVLYRLLDVLAAVAIARTVYIAEGEKDVEALRRFDVVATCNPGGAGQWRPEYGEALRGADVVIVADADEAGRRHAYQVAAALEGIASEVRIVVPAQGNDAFDHLAAGLLVEQFQPLDQDQQDPGGEPAGGGARTQAGQLVDLAMGAGLFHTPSGEPFATFPVGDHRETWPLRSRRFKAWLSKKYYERDGAVPTAGARNDALAVLEGIATNDGPTIDVHVRIGAEHETTYLDLGNDEWEVVRIDREGWHVEVDSTVRFRRSSGTLPLPRPERGGNIGLLRPFVNVAADGWILFISWLVSCFRAVGTYPVLNLLGEQGSAKSTAARIARALVDPNRAALRTTPKNAHDFILTASNAWVAALDNLSVIPDWLSDALCRLASGGGLATRALYTDAEEVIFDAQRPIVMTGISELATRSDLLDRSLLVTLPNITEDQRLSERELWSTFEKVRPQILGALLDAVAVAIRDVDDVALPHSTRMADFTLFSAAAAPALGWSGEEFLAVYEANRSGVHEIAVDDSPIGPAILELGAHGFEGTATELLGRLGSLVAEGTRKERGWPKTGRALSGALRRLAPNLRALGIEVSFVRETTGEKRRLIRLRPRRGSGPGPDAGSGPVTPVTPDTGPPGGPADGDAGVGAGDEGGDAADQPRSDSGPGAMPHSSDGDAGDESDASPDYYSDEAVAERLFERHGDLAGGEAS